MCWLSVSDEKLVRHDTRGIVYYVRKRFKHISMYWLMVTPVKIIIRPSYALLSILIVHSFSLSHHFAWLVNCCNARFRGQL